MTTVSAQNIGPLQTLYRDLRPQQIPLPDPTNMFKRPNILCCYGTSYLNVLDDACSELVRACVHVPLPELTQDRYDVEGWQGKALYIVCPEQLDRDDAATRGQDPAAEEGTGGGTGGAADTPGRGDASGRIKSSPQAKILDHSEAILKRVEGGARGPWAEGLQACIRLQKVMGHEDVFLVS